MCVYEFDWYYEQMWWGTLPGSGHSPCSCGRDPEPGELVYLLIGFDYNEGSRCLTAKRSALNPGKLADEWHDCDHCEEGWRPERHLDSLCQWCCAAAYPLDVWCSGEFSWDHIPRQLEQHWHEDELYRSKALDGLARLGANQWRYTDSNRPVELDHVRWLADRAVEAVQARDQAG